MNDLRKAAQIAVEALEADPDDMVEVTKDHWEYKREQAWKILRAALAQPEKTNQCAETCERAKLCAVCASGVDDVNPEPVAKVELMTTGGNAGLATRIVEIDDHLRERLRPGQLLYNSPPQRQPLTEDEISEIAMSCSFVSESDTYFARAIEKAHGIE